MKSIPQITNNTTQTNNLHPEHSGSSNHAIASAVFAAFGLMPLAADAVQEPQPTGWPLVGQAEFSYVNLTGSGHVGEYPNAAAGALPSNWGTGNVDPNTGAIVPGSWLASHAKLVSMLDSLPASPDVLLIGDSITQQWGNPLNEGTTFPTEINSSWQKYFPNYNAVSIGIGGDTTSGVLWRLNHGGLKGTNTSRPIAPKAVVLLIGTNNIGGATNTDIAKGVRACVDNIRQHLPNTRVLVVGVLPRYDVASVGSQVAPLNIEITKALRDLTDTIDPMVGLLDIGANFYNADGTVKAEAFRDKLHLTDANTVPYGVECGYDIYARSIQAKLDALILQGNQGNHYPSIGSIPDQAISPDTATTQIAFSVGDSETDAGSLRVSATSSNTSLVPNANIVLTGSGAIRAVKITPAPKMVGSTIITLQVTDAGGLTAKKTFTVNVGPLQPALVICDDGYKNGWFEAGTAGNTTNGTPVHSGISSTTVGFSSGSTIYNLFNNQGGSDVSTYQSLSFWIHGGTAGGQKVKLYLRQSADSSGLKAVNIMLSLPPFPRNTWGKYTVPLAAFKAAGGVKLQSFMFQSDGDPSPFFIDDIVLDPNNPVSAGTVPTAPGAPVLITQPASATATAGTSVTLNITATGTPAPTYQWQSAPKGSVAFTNIPNATTASLNISALTIADNGKQFRCIVRNEQGSVTSSVSVLTVNAQPSVGFVLANQRVMEGDGTASIAVQLSAPCSRDVAIPFSLSGTALSSTDYTVTQSPLVIPAGATSGEIKVTLVNDSTYQYWDRNVVVTLGTPSNAIKGASAVHTLNIGDDDAIPGVEPQPDGWPLTAEERKYVTTLPYSVRWPNAVDSRATASVADWWGKDGAPNDAYLSKHTQLVETVQRNQGPIDVLLVGDSITQQWGGWFPPTPDDGVTFTKDALWPKEFPQFKTVNIGIGGDKTFGVQWRLRHGGVDGLAPRMVVLAIGTNNLQMGQSLESIAQGVMECVNQLRRKLPSSQVLVMGVLPRNDDANAGALVAPFNEILRKKILNSDGGKLDAQVNWLDIGALMKDANGNLKANVFRDGIHLTQDVGYKIYADALRPVFNNLIPASGNRPPTITPIATQLIAPNGVSAPIPFSVGDSTSSPESLTITATSSNPDVVPVSGIQISGTGANRSLVITPVANKKGSTTVRLSVSDGALTSTCIFDVNVATFTPLSGYVIYQDSIQAGWNDAPSWNVTRNTESSAEVYNGLKSLAVTPTASGGALSLYQSNPISIAPYQSASFAIHGGPSGGQKLQLMLIYTTNGTTSEQNVPITLAGNRWETYTIPLNPPGGTGDTRLQNIRFRDLGTGRQGTYYVDDLTLNLKASAPAPVTITKQPINAVVEVGGNTTFSVAANGNPTPTYQWQSAPKGSSTFANITGATAASYTTSAATSVDDGRQFRCVVTNSVGSVTSGVSTLNVNAAPAITTQAANATVVAGTSATFSVAASGNPTPTYQWQSAPKGSSTF
ncbi:MAG: GDSL-type esterase/lipase family protein, partial [Verrucomicrobiota bacterium]